MRPFVRIADTVLKWGTLLMTGAFIGCILVQIYARLFMTTAPSWTEEAARLFFVLAIAFAAGPALKRDYYVYFDFVYDRLAPRWRRPLLVAIDALTVLLFLLFLYHAVAFTVMGLAERSPSMQFPMVIAFGSMVVLALSVLLYAVKRLLAHLPANSGQA
ncbi:TRAP-type C4-dicarboxylate transport system permease small subunit [Neolewinella xylanilytica]|uniref:TRAP-type C4-dicarboxylate transport system permease small subunit n=1 Tax=Neolewinella xylanilytica TaxID=1514080 RepID=A0A2S6I1J6_9BACT|nr:TRAP transporter small permease [Neolewinella xylanilytica]PPK84751.1 TRAP-type C4-dicarboxylate transport system permease small subunit [Neolewinella xylanilytica]